MHSYASEADLKYKYLCLYFNVTFTIYVPKMLIWGVLPHPTPHFTQDENMLKFSNKECVLNIRIYFKVLFLS